MNAQQPLYMDKPAFLAWVEGRDGRYELAGGQVVMMTGGTVRHSLIVSNVLGLLRQKLDRKRWLVLPDVGIDVGPRTFRYPDVVVVDRSGENIQEPSVRAPVFVVEVLSPSTTKTDFGDKGAEYVQFPSLGAYLILAQDEVKAWLYVRDLKQFLPPQIVKERTGSLDIPLLHVVMPLADIYEGVEFDDVRQDGTV